MAKKTIIQKTLLMLFCCHLSAIIAFSLFSQQAQNDTYLLNTHKDYYSLHFTNNLSLYSELRFNNLKSLKLFLKDKSLKFIKNTYHYAQKKENLPLFHPQLKVKNSYNYLKLKQYQTTKSYLLTLVHKKDENYFANLIKNGYLKKSPYGLSFLLKH